jgi:hypothetical protein
MFRPLVRAAIILLLVAPTLAAQQAEEQTPTQVYLAYYKIGYGDLGEWINLYHEHSVPILAELRDEGVIQGWGAWQHSTGSEYNWRFAVRATEWAQFDEFWSEYLGRLNQRSPEATARSTAMIMAHYDEIWDITDMNVPDGLDVQYLYDSRFQIGFADLGEWNRLWSQVATPSMNQGMEDEHLGGWVEMGHNTGGRYNRKVLYLFEAWDDMDDFFEGFLAQLTANPDVWADMGRMIAAHDDVIWEAVPDPMDM